MQGPAEAKVAALPAAHIGAPGIDWEVFGVI